jgi:transcriptional regulator with XRE-family HTH domain
MNLREYLASKGQTAAEFGKATGQSEHAVKKWLREERIPSKDAMAAIFRETGGEVTANDFHGQHVEAAE